LSISGDGGGVFVEEVAFDDEGSHGGFFGLDLFEDGVELFGDLLGVEADEADVGAFAEDGDEEAFAVEGAHEDVHALAFVVEGAEFGFAEAFGQFVCGGEGAGGEGGEDAEVEVAGVTVLGEEVAAFVDKGGPLGF